MHEIGGYIELGSLVSAPYHSNAIGINTATNALIYIIKAKKIKKIFLPYYLCECINKIDSYCDVERYCINSDFLPCFNKKLRQDEYLYFVNYFGLFDNKRINKIVKKYKNVIVDNVQAFFQKPLKEVDTLYSCRKFFGVPDGAYLYTNRLLKDEISRDKSLGRFTHIFGRLENNAKDYYSSFTDNEKLLENEGLKFMSKSTESIMNAINYVFVKQKRNDNFKFLNKKLSQNNKIKIKNVEGPYMYPYYSKKADELKIELLKRNIYISTLWPNVFNQDVDSNALDFAKNILPIPCDQRYSIDDMKLIINLIKEYDK